MRRLTSIGIALLALSHFAFANVSSALAQAGSTGGFIGKGNKSISGSAVPASKVHSHASRKRTKEEARNTSLGCGGIIGDWHWSGLKIVFKPDGSTQSSNGDTGTWACAKKTITASWKSGFVDHITISSDGTQLSVTNNVWGSISGRK